MAIPGRVGYQCANFYRALVSSGEIKDSKYGFDENGRMYIKEGKRKRKNIEECSSSVESRKKRRRARNTEEEFDDEDYTSSDEDDNTADPVGSNDADGSDDETILCLFKKSTLRHYQNPLAGFKDSITNEEVVVPCISPYGHVLSHKTWLKVLTENEPQGRCPFTKQPLTMRDLVRLTFENIDKYRSLIKNSNDE